jgi:hypothetical protein
MVNAAAVFPEEQHFTLASLSPSRAQRRLALAVVLALLGAFFITAGPLSTIQAGRIDAFVPAYATAMFVSDSITAVLLFAQFSILRSRALLAMSSGYLFTALIVIPWLLTFPGVFTPGGLLGAGLQSTNWLYILWHAGFPTFVMAYALLKDADPAKRLWRRSIGAAILSSVATTAAVVCAATFLVTAGGAVAPYFTRSGPFFYPLALCCRVSSPMERPYTHCALDTAAFGARSVADGGDAFPKMKSAQRGSNVVRASSAPLHRYHAVFTEPGIFFAVRSWADCITDMFGFDLRQTQAGFYRTSERRVTFI